MIDTFILLPPVRTNPVIINLYMLSNQPHQIKTLPSQISYNKLSIPSSSPPQDGTTTNTTITLGRREVFDIRTQLMAEDENDSEELISGLEKGDIKPNFYEGGFKTWECAIDLAKLMVSEEERGDVLGLGNDVDEGDVHVIEVGCLVVPFENPRGDLSWVI